MASGIARTTGNIKTSRMIAMIFSPRRSLMSARCYRLTPRRRA
jgi:hypothetical protein